MFLMLQLVYILWLQEKLSDAEDGLEAAARLHQQLDKCDQIIAALKEEGQWTVTLYFV